jgi:GT2 family glycosyltransferase
LATTVCAIVPTYNRAALLPDCLGSLLRQTRPLDQIIVVNDGATDNTEEVLRSYAGTVLALRQENAGKSAALNNALAKCEHDYVWVCDDDDIAQPYACAALASALDADPGAGFAYGQFQRFRDVNGTREILPMSYWPRSHEQAFFLEILERCFVFQFCCMIRRSVYRDVGPFDTRLLRSQDYDMIVRVARRHRGVYVAKPLFLQRSHEGSRGAATDRFSSDAAAEKWLVYDRLIFDRVRTEIPLDELTPPFARSLPASQMQRAALLQRACIFGRHAMWRESTADLEQASALAPTLSASPEELAIVARTLSEANCVPRLLQDRALRDRLRRLIRYSAFGRSIAEALASPLFWQINASAKARQAKAAWSRLLFLITLLSVPRVVMRVSNLVIRRLSRRQVGSQSQ